MENKSSVIRYSFVSGNKNRILHRSLPVQHFRLSNHTKVYICDLLFQLDILGSGHVEGTINTEILWENVRMKSNNSTVGNIICMWTQIVEFFLKINRYIYLKKCKFIFEQILEKRCVINWCGFLLPTMYNFI